MKKSIEIVRMTKLDGDSNIKAFCDISLFDSVILKGFRVMTGSNGDFVSPPREQGKDGNWYSTVYFTSESVKKAIQDTVLNAYAI